VLARELGYAKSLPESGAGQVSGTRLMLRTGSSLTGTSARRQASSTRVQFGRGGSIYDRHGRRDHRPGRAEIPRDAGAEEQEYLRMLAEDFWADGTEIGSGWTEDTSDE
jgi:hypothetical protein